MEQMWVHFRSLPPLVQAIAWILAWPVVAGLFLAQWERLGSARLPVGVVTFAVGALLVAGLVFGEQGRQTTTALRDPTPSPVPRVTLPPIPTPTPLPVAEPTAAPTPVPTPQPPPPPPEPGFGTGTYVVGQDIHPGTYRSSGTSLCYWARLRGFGGELADIIANGNTSPEIVTIAPSDTGFETQGCGRWVPVEHTAPATPHTSFGNGTYQVGVHIAPGRYRADGSGICYWARLSSFSHAGIDGIIANGNNPTVVEISPSDAGFTAYDCGTWTRQ